MEKDMYLIKKLAKPLVDYLYENHNPYTSIVVSMDSIRVVVDEKMIPLEIREEEDILKKKLAEVERMSKLY